MDADTPSFEYSNSSPKVHVAQTFLFGFSLTEQMFLVINVLKLTYQTQYIYLCFCVLESDY